MCGQRIGAVLKGQRGEAKKIDEAIGSLLDGGATVVVAEAKRLALKDWITKILNP